MTNNRKTVLNKSIGSIFGLKMTISKITAYSDLQVDETIYSVQNLTVHTCMYF